MRAFLMAVAVLPIAGAFVCFELAVNDSATGQPMTVAAHDYNDAHDYN